MTVAPERRTFPSSPASAREARRFVESVLITADLDHLTYPATVLVSELVANAVLHTSTPVEVVVWPEPDRVRVEVHDGSPQLPIRKHYSNMSGTGRGLLLVERMATEWGSGRTDGGKVVWFELDGRDVPVIDILGVDSVVSTALVTVRILGLPLDVFRRASEHNDELLREFALVRQESSDHVPTRLLVLIDELTLRFGSFSEGPRQEVQQALDRGDTEVDLRYDVPGEVADAARRLGSLLDDADEFCRSGDLLTLAAAPESLAFRRWFLEEFVRQVAGQPPQAWSAFLEAAPG